MIGEIMLFFSYWYYPTTTNVITNLETISADKNGEVTSEILYKA
jgi:hypothetical protein